MNEKPHPSSSRNEMRLEAIQRRIASFTKRFGMRHLYLAYHAAFPLALTPDLLYRLWANFPRDTHGTSLKIPWVAVADLLLSGLCEEVGQELYEMNAAVREELLRGLKASPNFGEQRINELSNFLLAYVQQQLHSPDPAIRDFASAQQWVALAYLQPSRAVSKLVETLRTLDWNDRAEQLRVASLIETLIEPLSDFAPLLMFTRGLAHFARGEMKDAEIQFRNATGGKDAVDLGKIRLRIPKGIYERIEKVRSQDQGTTADQVTEPAQTLQRGSRVFSPYNLRYNLEKSFPRLYAYLYQRAQRYLGELKYDAFEVDQVVGHVIDYLTRIGLLGGADSAPETALDRLTNAQFYAFLNRSIQNKAIDRLRKKRLPTTSISEIEISENVAEEEYPLEEVVESFWGGHPFSTLEEQTLERVSQEELRILLKHCIKSLSNAPRQFQAIIQELEEIGADELVEEMRKDFPEAFPTIDLPLTHLSQHKDHAHKKLRHCLQMSSTNLAVMIALRLTEYGVRPSGSDEMVASIETLMQDDLSELDVRVGLKQLVAEGLLDWHGEEIIRFSLAQEKRLARFYEGE